MNKTEPPALAIPPAQPAPQAQGVNWREHAEGLFRAALLGAYGAPPPGPNGERLREIVADVLDTIQRNIDEAATPPSPVAQSNEKQFKALREGFLGAIAGWVYGADPDVVENLDEYLLEVLKDGTLGEDLQLEVSVSKAFQSLYPNVKVENV